MRAPTGLPAGWRRGVLAALALLLGGCSPNASGVALPPAAPEVRVEIVEHELVYERPVPAGRVVFHVENGGGQPHQLTLVSLAEGTPPLAEQLREPPDEAPALIARVPPLRPGETGMFAAWLAEGQRYALVDLSEGPDGVTYAELGVATEFRVPPADAPQSRDTSAPPT